MTDDTSPEDKKTTIPAGAPIKKVDPNALAARAAAQKAEAKPIARRMLAVGGEEVGDRPKLFSQADEVEIQKPRFVTPLLKEQLEKEAAEAAARAEEEAARAAEEEARRAEEEARLAAEAAARAAAEAEEEARRQAEEQARAEEEARRAQEEYERQMREYEEQLAAYERQQAEEARLAAEQAAAQQAEAARLAAEQAAAHATAQHAAAIAQPQAAAPAPAAAPMPTVAPMPAAGTAGAPLAANLQATLDQIRAMQEALAAQAQAMAMVAQQAGIAAPVAQPYAAPAFAPVHPAAGTPLPAAPPAQAPAAAPVKLGAPKLSLSALKSTPAAHHDPAAPQAAAPASPFAGAPAPALARPSLAAQPHTPAASPFAGAPTPAPMLAPHTVAAADTIQPETAPSEPAAPVVPKLSLNAGAVATPSLATPKLARPGLSLQSSGTTTAGTQTAADADNQDPAAAEAAEQARQDAYYHALQAAATQTPWHKKKSVLFMLGGFAALFIGVGIALYFKMQGDNAQRIEDQKIQSLLKVAENINKSLIREPKGDLSLEALQQKNVGLGTINKESCQRLLRVIKDQNRDIGVARNAIIYLVVMMAQDAYLCQLVIDDIVKNPEPYDKDRFDWLTQNIAATRMPNAKQLLLDLAEKINTKNPSNKDMYIGEIYKNIAGLVDAGDFDAMVKLVNDEKTSGKLAAALSNNLYTIIEQTYKENPEAAAALGDKLVADVNDKKMAGMLVLALAQAGSPKGFEMIKTRMANAADPRAAYGVWTNVKQALSMWSNDSVVPYLVELRSSENPMIAKEVETALAAMINHDTNRTEEEFDRLVMLVYGDLNTDTSEYDELNNQLSPGSAMEVKPTDPRHAGLLERMEKVKPIHDQKIVFCKSLSNHTAKPHVIRYLEKMSKDSDRLVAIEAKAALTRVKENTKKAEATKASAEAKKS